MTVGFELAGRRFSIPVPIVGVGEAGEREIAAVVPATATRVGDDIISYAMTADAADLTLATTGRAPLLIEHMRTFDALVGALTDAWLDGPVLCLTGRLAIMPDADRVWAMMTAGFPVSLSLGAEIDAAEATGSTPWGGQRFLVLHWRLVEVSFCAVGKNVAARAVRLDSDEGRAIIATRKHPDRDAARQRLRLDEWQRWVPGAACRMAERLAVDALELGELLGEEASAHGERLLAT